MQPCLLVTEVTPGFCGPLEKTNHCVDGVGAASLPLSSQDHCRQWEKSDRVGSAVSHRPGLRLLCARTPLTRVALLPGCLSVPLLNAFHAYHPPVAFLHGGGDAQTCSASCSEMSFCVLVLVDLNQSGLAEDIGMLPWTCILNTCSLGWVLKS